MQKRPLGETGLLVSKICLGTMTWGQQNTEAEGHAQLDLALDRGVNFLDTAELYSIPPKPETQGSTERIIGTWLKARGSRDKVVVASKVVGRTAMDWFRGGRPSKLVREDIVQAVERSLRNLQTDVIDLYQIHWPERNTAGFGSNPNRQPTEAVERLSDETPIAETLAVFDELQKAGKIKHLGLSNESAWGVMRFIFESEKGVGPRVASLQNAYNFVNRTAEVNLVEVCEREQVAFLPYSPLAQGFLSGKYDNGALPEGSRKVLFNRSQRYESPNAAEAILAYNRLAREFSMEPALFANAFVVNQSFVTSNIIGATSIPQLETALASADVTWTPEMQKAVNDLHQKFGNPCP